MWRPRITVKSLEMEESSRAKCRASRPGERGGAYAAFDQGHGYACHPRETQVPLIVHGQGIPEGRWSGAVSGLDVVPTLLEAMNLPPPGNLDGFPLPLSAAVRPESRAFVAHGFCSDSRREGEEQLLWWVEGCRVREMDGTPLSQRAELWNGERRVRDPARLETLMEQHEEWLLSRLPFDSFVFGVDRLEDATVRVEAEGGRIVDFGPAGSVYGIDKIELLGLSDEDTTLRVRFRGYQGPLPRIHAPAAGTGQDRNRRPTGRRHFRRVRSSFPSPLAIGPSTRRATSRSFWQTRRPRLERPEDRDSGSGGRATSAPKTTAAVARCRTSTACFGSGATSGSFSSTRGRSHPCEDPSRRSAPRSPNRSRSLDIRRRRPCGSSGGDPSG